MYVCVRVHTPASDYFLRTEVNIRSKFPVCSKKQNYGASHYININFSFLQ